MAFFLPSTQPAREGSQASWEKSSHQGWEQVQKEEVMNIQNVLQTVHSEGGTYEEPPLAKAPYPSSTALVIIN